MSNNVAPIVPQDQLVLMDARGRMPGEPGYDATTSMQAQQAGTPPPNLVPQARPLSVLFQQPASGVPVTNDLVDRHGPVPAGPVTNDLVDRHGLLPPGPLATPIVDRRQGLPFSGGGGDLASSIIATSKALGINPVDLGTAMAYETGGTFDPWKAGPTTQWGQHRGLIQWGEPQRAKYGVYQGMPVGDQVAAAGHYLQDAGVRPGMGLLDIYSAINAGHVGRYSASDANNGGAPGTVADKVASMAPFQQKALAMLGQGEPGAAPLSPTSGLSIGMAAAVNAGNGIGPALNLVKPSPGLSPGMATATNAATQPDLTKLFAASPFTNPKPATAAPIVPATGDPVPLTNSNAGSGAAYAGTAGGHPGTALPGYAPPISLRPFQDPDPSLGSLASSLAQQQAKLDQQRQAGAQPAQFKGTGLAPLFIA